METKRYFIFLLLVINIYSQFIIGDEYKRPKYCVILIGEDINPYSRYLGKYQSAIKEKISESIANKEILFSSYGEIGYDSSSDRYYFFALYEC